MSVEAEPDWGAAVVDLLRRVKQTQPDALAADFSAAVRPLGLAVTVYLVDLEQERLWAMPEPGRPTAEPVLIEGTPAGRAFTSISTVPGPADDSAYRIWVPMVDGSERLGVAEFVAGRPPGDPDAFRRHCEMMLGLIGHLVSTKAPYGDALHRIRRTRPMAPSGELLMSALPPLTFSHRRMAVSALLEPVYEVGGDAFDYAVDGDTARVLVLDAMGRGLQAALTSSAALAAIRSARRHGGDLLEMAAAADTAISESFRDVRFATGVLADLDLGSGLLRYLNAGHPHPVLFRDGRAAAELTGGRRTPIGLGADDARAGEEILRPGDRLLLFTDGVTEAFDASGERFGVERLIDLTERCLAANLPPAETLRRLTRSVRAHQPAPPSDDATLLLIEWSADASARSIPDG